jgi:tetratricopeptide (TPR) repeat protein
MAAGPLQLPTGQPLTAAIPPGYAATMLAVRFPRHIVALAVAGAFLSAAALTSAVAQDAKDRKPSQDPPQATPAPKAKKQQRGSNLPKTPAEREKTLSDLYALLATAEDEEAAKAISDAIERVWLHSGSATVDLLMERSIKAMSEKNPKLALKLLDSVVDLAPDFTEAWNRRAYVHFVQKDTERALGDLRRALALDPSHYKALDGLAQILREMGQKKPALKAFRQLLEVHPYWSGAQQAVEELEREVDGQGI